MRFGRRNYKIRCYCCDKLLTDYETSLVNLQTGDYEDTCLKCLRGLSIKVKGNPDLLRKNEEKDDFDLPQDDDWFDLNIPDDSEEEE